jgi:hypothetical protein
MFTIFIVWVTSIVVWPLILGFIWAVRRLYLKFKSFPSKVTAKLFYDLGLVSISAGGFSVLAGITQQTTQEEMIVRAMLSLIFIIGGAIIIYISLEKK